MYTDPTKNLKAFESITELATYAKTVMIGDDFRTGNKFFFGANSYEQILALSALGDDAAVPAAQALLSKLENSLSVETTAYESSVAGCFPNVPEFLAGEPECMMDAVQIDSDSAPLAIYVDLTTSGGISAEDYHKRGIAVLALTMLLSAVRPVSLHVCTVMGTHETTAAMRKRGENYCIVTARVETAPLDLARAAFMLTNVGVPRRLFYGVANTSGKWPGFQGVSYADSTCAANIKRVRELLDVSGDTLYLPAVSVMAGDFQQMVNQPVQWLNAKLTQYGGLTATA